MTGSTYRCREFFCAVRGAGVWGEGVDKTLCFIRFRPVLFLTRRMTGTTARCREFFLTVKGVGGLGWAKYLGWFNPADL